MGTRVTEVERKYEVPADFELPELTGGSTELAVDEPVTHRLTATYYDTEGFTLARHGVTLRYRTGGTDAGWHLKRPAAPGARTEIRAPRPSSGRNRVPAAFDDELAALRRGRQLDPVVRMSTRRIERTVRSADGTPVALIADDRVTVRSPDGLVPPASWREIEVELADGADAAVDVLDALEGRLLEAGAHPASVGSKLARALSAALPPTPKDGRAWRPVAGYARAQREAIIALDPAVRRDDSEAVHDFRVAVRRLRSTLRTFRQLLPVDRSEPVRAELRWLASELGPVRDLEVIAERLADAVAAEPPELVIGPVGTLMSERFTGQRERARESALASLDTDRYFTLLDQLDELLDQPPERRPVNGEVRKLVRTAVRRAERRLASAAEPATGDPAASEPAHTAHEESAPEDPAIAAASAEAAAKDAALHEARRSAKRARYAVEVLVPTAGKPAERVVGRLKDVQDLLGTHQDTVVAREILRAEADDAEAAGQSAFTFGLLHGRQAAVAANTLTRLPHARTRVRTAVKRWLG
ncbi:MAG TPA: CYTH and CHAD domain-containing protein [Actinomycetes bacterium]|nr:CYTH and CHAD domain-containing protein [Actinomycetes bacterium]